MALNATTIEATVKSAVKAQFLTSFGDPPPTSAEDIADAMAEVIAQVVPGIIAAVKSDADLTGVTAGSDTVSGGVD